MSIRFTKTVLYYFSCIGYLGFERKIVNLYCVEKKIFVNDKTCRKIYILYYEATTTYIGLCTSIFLFLLICT